MWSDMSSTKYYTLWGRPASSGWKTPNLYSPLRYGGYSSSLGDPCSRPLTTVKRPLTGQKEVIYNPHLPSLRRMDMDEVLQKLPEQHSRHTTPCTKEDFKNATITLFRPASHPLSGPRYTETGRMLQTGEYKPVESKGTAYFLTRSINPEEAEYEPPRTATAPIAREEPAEPTLHMPDHLRYSSRQQEFNGYATRYLSPRITGGWRYSLRQEPFTDLRGQRPVPANIYSRYRHAHPLRSISLNQWR